MDDRTSHSDVTERILSGARWATFLRLIGQIVSWGSTILVVRFLSPKDYGLNSMLEAPMEILLLFGTLGLDVALVQSRELGDRALSGAFGMLLALGFASFACYFLGAPYFAAYFAEPALGDLARALSPIFLLVPLRVIPDALLDRQLKFKLRATVETWSSVLATVLTLVLAVNGAGVWALVFGVLANRTLNTVLLMAIQPWFVRPSFNFRDTQSLIVFGGFTAGAGVVLLVAGKSVTFIAGPTVGAATLGVLALAVQFAQLPVTRVMPIVNPVLVPAFARFRSEPGVAAEHLEKSLRILAILLVPVMIGLACLAGPFVRVFFGERWDAVIVPLALISAVLPVKIIPSLIRPVMSSLGRADLVFILSLIFLASAVAGAFIARSHGLMGLVVMSVTLEVLMALATLVLARRALAIPMVKVARAFRPSLVSSAAMVAAVYLLHLAMGEQTAAVSLAAGVMIGAAAYSLAMVLLFRESLLLVMRVVLGR